MWTDAEKTRVIAIEEELNRLSTAIGNLMSKTQMKQLLVFRQDEIDSLSQRVTALEAQITILQNRDS